MKKLFHGLSALFSRLLNKKYPKEYLKGVPNTDYVTDDRKIRSHLFQFKNPEKIRADKWIEDSINWNDDSGAIDEILTKRKKDTEVIQFKAGVAIFPRDQLDELMTHNQVKDQLCYERRKFIDNDYHGNLLVHADTDSPTRRQIAGAIALTLSELIDNPFLD